MVIDPPLEGEGPFYTEYLYNLLEENPTFGIASLTWNTSLTSLIERKEAIIKMFNEVYFFREIGAETIGRWIKLLQVKLDVISETYDRSYRLYKLNNLDEIAKTSESTSRNKFQDTPVTALMEKDYATNITDMTTSSKITDEMTVNLVNKNIAKWNYLDRMFVEEFRNLFYNSLARV